MIKFQNKTEAIKVYKTFMKTFKGEEKPLIKSKNPSIESFIGWRKRANNWLRMNNKLFN